ncbi:MAG: hypothetical protein JRI41_08110 [Deltaproteobacteria bacterium]|nr:hypothetical protein [Deltaproteobacteria bacterium]
MKCRICGKEPKQIGEYIHAAEEEGISPEEYVREEEGTYNQFTELFYCTECYIKIGMPLGKA